MSKAFTREDDDLPVRPAFERVRIDLPPGANLFTPDGLKNLRAELEQLADSPSNRPRILELQQKLDGAVVVPPPEPLSDRVLFGATVTVRYPDGEETTYRIVGVHEMDLDRNWISLRSPLARALLGARAGEQVRFRAPVGEQVLDILAVRYG